MLSKKFVAWFGVGVLSVATIPTFAAPHLARLVSRKPAVAQAKPTAHKPAATATPKITLTAKPTATRTASTAKLASHKPAPLSTKKTATKAATKTATKTATKLTAKPAAAPKATNGRLQAIQQTNKPTASSTAKKLLH